MAKQDVKLKTIKDLYFYYSNFYTPVLTKNAKDNGAKSVGDKGENGEYVVKVAMSEEVFFKMKKNADMKGAKNFKEAKDYSIAEFEAAYHPEGGMPDFGDDVTDVVLVKFAQKAFNEKSKKSMNPPKLIGIVGKTKDHNGEEVNQEVLVGNGSKGHLQVRPVDFGEYGLYLYPHAVAITDLVVYEGGGEVDADYDAFGIEEDEEAEDNLDDDDFDDVPF